MQLEHSFTVPVPVETAWEILLDVPRVAPCMPGATLTEFDGDAFAGSVKVKLGPITLTYRGKGRFVERDEAAHRMVMEASGKDTRSAGTASATVTAMLKEDGDRTSVECITELNVTGRPAQFGRGMIADVGAKLIGQFADCLASTLGAGAEHEPAVARAGSPSVPAGEPAGGPAVAGATSAAAATATAADPAAAAARAARPVTEPTAEAEPIDVLKLGGGLDVTRRAGYALAALALAVIAWIVLRRLRR